MICLLKGFTHINADVSAGLAEKSMHDLQKMCFGQYIYPIYWYVSMHVCMYVHMYVHLYIIMYVCMYVCLYACMYA